MSEARIAEQLAQLQLRITLEAVAHERAFSTHREPAQQAGSLSDARDREP